MSARTGADTRSYYGRPVIKEPVWTWEIPTYLFTGGLAGASAAFGLAAKASGNGRLARTAILVGAAADAVSPPLLVSDLGRPDRFHHMFRVFKVTSPMNVGAWVLLVSGGASSTAALLELSGRLSPVRRAAELVSALAGPPLATYTGVLLADTAVPAWHESRRLLPGIFGASAAASAGAAAAVFADPADAAPARRLALAGLAAESVLTGAMQRRLGGLADVYRRGRPRRLARAARGLGALGGALLATRGRRRRGAAALGGALVCAAELSLRWAVFEAGRASARDPRHTVGPQRARLAAARDGDASGAPRDGRRDGTAAAGPGFDAAAPG